MGITEHQLEQRRNFIGSSDLAAVCGFDKYRSPHDVYLSKIHKMKNIENAAMKIGTHLEDGIISYAETEIGKVTRNQRRRVHGTHIAVNIDGIVNATGKPLEIKAVAVMSNFANTDDWGEAGSGDVPDAYNIQCHGHMLGLTANPAGMIGYPEFCHLYALIGGRGIVGFKIPFDRETADFICEKAVEFWDEHVVPQCPPTESLASKESLKRVIRVPNKIIKGNDDVAEWWEKRMLGKQNEKAVTTVTDSYNSKIIQFFGDAEAVELPSGERLTYMETIRDSVDLKKLKLKEPELYDSLAIKYHAESRFRVLRIKSAKAVQKEQMRLTKEEKL